MKDRIHISREGNFVLVLTLSKKNNRLVKTPDIVSRRLYTWIIRKS